MDRNLYVALNGASTPLGTLNCNHRLILLYLQNRALQIKGVEVKLLLFSETWQFFSVLCTSLTRAQILVLLAFIMYMQ